MNEFADYPVERWPIAASIADEGDEDETFMLITRYPGKPFSLIQIEGAVRPVGTGSVIETTLPSPPSPYRMPFLSGLGIVALCGLVVWDHRIVPGPVALVLLAILVAVGFIGRAGQAEYAQHAGLLERFLLDAAPS